MAERGFSARAGKAGGMMIVMDAMRQTDHTVGVPDRFSAMIVRLVQSIGPWVRRDTGTRPVASSNASG